MQKTIDFDLVADWYDHYVSVAFDIPFYRTLCKRLGAQAQVLELMCGTGRVSLPLLADGVRLTCVDYSQKMLDEFAKKAPQDVPLVCQDICELDLGKQFSFAFIPFHSFSEIVDRSKQAQAIARIYEHLVCGGEFLVTLYNPAYRAKTADGLTRCVGKFHPAPDRTLIVTYYNQLDPGENRVTGTQFYELYDETNRLVEKRFLDISFALISKDEIMQMCQDAGFTLKAVYGDYEFGEFTDGSAFMHLLFVKLENGCNGERT